MHTAAPTVPCVVCCACAPESSIFVFEVTLGAPYPCGCADDFEAAPRDLGQPKPLEVVVGVGQWFRIVMAWSLVSGDFGNDHAVVGAVAGLAGYVAESGNIGGATAGFFQFGRRKVFTAGNSDVFEVRPEFDFFFTGEFFDGAAHSGAQR